MMSPGATRGRAGSWTTAKSSGCADSAKARVGLKRDDENNVERRREALQTKPMGRGRSASGRPPIRSAPRRGPWPAMGPVLIHRGPLCNESNSKCRDDFDLQYHRIIALSGAMIL